MKRVIMGLTLAFTLLASTGCGVMGKRGCNSCNSCNGPTGCRPCNLGWQRGGTDYQRFLGNNGGPGSRLGQRLASQPPGAGGPAGAPAAQVAYPYYTARGPRDFLMDNPPTIGR